MPGILGLINLRNVAPDRFESAVATLDLLGRTPPFLFGNEEARMAVATIPDPPMHGPFHIDNQEIAACFAGDLHNRKTVPWANIVSDMKTDSFAWTDLAEGHFAVAVYEKRRRRCRLFADHFGWHPVFYARHGEGLVFGTQLAAFVRLGVGGSFDEEWFHQFLFFGYWMGERTYLEGVKRLRPGTVLTFEVDNGALTLQTYEEPFTQITPTLRGRKAIDRALSVFRQNIPPMFDGGRKVQFALSGGVDSRTLYAFLPEDVNHAAFTYGMAGCDDHLEASATARKLEIPHRQLFFDTEYEENLPSQIYETVWLSGGLAWVNRCMLPTVFRFVADEPGPSPILSSGIALDTLFRGHNNGRGDVHLLLATGDASFTDQAYAEILPGPTIPRFKETVVAAVDDLTRWHGRLSRSESYLSYTAYTLCPSYFTADLEIGGHYLTLRVPGFDRATVKLAYELEYSTIYLSKFLPHDYFDEYILQASLMYSHPRLARIPHTGIPLDVFVRNDKVRYQYHRILKHGLRYLRRRFSRRGDRTPIEDWPTWFGTILAPDMRALLGPGSLVANYVQPEVFEHYLATNRWPWLARLSSVEIVLQLMANGWELEQLTYPGVRPAVRS